jgi:lipoprotein-anchoring transpeptidase ErfK/SrfK
VALTLAVVMTVALGAAPAVAEQSSTGAHAPARVPASAPSVVATAVTGEVRVFDEPGAASPSRVLVNPTKTDGPLVFLVDRAKDGWLEVLLPVKPNGATGWIAARDVALAQNPYRIVVQLTKHRLLVFKGQDRIMSTPAGIGTLSTPTPHGRYYLTQLFQPPDPTGPYGPFAYSLSGFSEVLQTFKGGDAIIGIHGTNQPELVGKDVSHGCIRVKNAVIRKLAAVLPLGTPVEIRKR